MATRATQFFAPETTLGDARVAMLGKAMAIKLVSSEEELAVLWPPSQRLPRTSIQDHIGSCIDHRSVCTISRAAKRESHTI